MMNSTFGRRLSAAGFAGAADAGPEPVCADPDAGIVSTAQATIAAADAAARGKRIFILTSWLADASG